MLNPKRTIIWPVCEKAYFSLVDEKASTLDNPAPRPGIIVGSVGSSGLGQAGSSSPAASSCDPRNPCSQVPPCYWEGSVVMKVNTVASVRLSVAQACEKILVRPLYVCIDVREPPASTSTFPPAQAPLWVRTCTPTPPLSPAPNHSFSSTSHTPPPGPPALLTRKLSPFVFFPARHPLWLHRILRRWDGVASP